MRNVVKCMLTCMNSSAILKERQVTGLIFLPYFRTYTEENIMRTRITLACTECKNRNYDTTKDKKTHPERMEINKYCKFCKKHTLHKETK